MARAMVLVIIAFGVERKIFLAVALIKANASLCQLRIAAFSLDQKSHSALS
jgi:hypothetical protein